MSGYIVHRLGQTVIVLLGVTLITFILQHLLPGSIAREIIGPKATSLQIANFDREYGLDRPLPIQYLSFLGQLLRGNLGFSFRLNQSVDSIVIHWLPDDVLLVGSSLVLSLLIAVPMGILQAVRRNGLVDYGATTVAFLLYSMPSYLLGILLITVFAINLHLLPAIVPPQSTFIGYISHPSALILPIATLTLVTYALFSRYMRSAAIDSLAQDWIKTARAKGLRQRTVLLHHVLRNSVLSIATLVGLSLPGILTFGLIIEYLFNFQGIGLEYYNAAVNGDYPVEFGITVLVGIVTVLGNLVADVAYAVLDPRVRYE
jgi:peptide/nickel transport system permease protein